ncbi:uncharacterized protein LOC144727673 isoform X2 [Lampetra planeri]
MQTFTLQTCAVSCRSEMAVLLQRLNCRRTCMASSLAHLSRWKEMVLFTDADDSCVGGSESDTFSHAVDQLEVVGVSDQDESSTDVKLEDGEIEGKYLSSSHFNYFQETFSDSSLEDEQQGLECVGKIGGGGVEDYNIETNEGKDSAEYQQLLERGEACGEAREVIPSREDKTGDIRPYRCTDCERVFPQRYQLKCHVREHTGEMPFVCEECGRGFHTLSTFTVHRRRHTGEKPYACEVCGKAFVSVACLRLHTRTHTGERPYVCDVCGRAFALKCALTVHQRTHTGKRPYVCEFCGKAFVVASALTVHRRIHTGERPVTCECCGAAFVSSSGLAKHMTSHTGEKKFVCKECGKAFARSSYLTQHVRMHTGEKPCVCSRCGKAFKQYAGLNYHKKKCLISCVS